MNQSIDTEYSDFIQNLSKLVNFPVLSLERIGQGRNSRVYIIHCDHSKPFIAKHYFISHSDKRERMEVEFSSLKFLYNHGIRCVPLPVIMDKELNCAIYEYVQGQRILSRDVSESDIDAAVQFLVRINELKGDAGSWSLPKASEACFSLKEVIDNISFRVKILQGVKGSSIPFQDLKDFLNDQFVSVFQEFQTLARTCYEQYLGIPYDSVLSWSERILSPSDFGFHNALRRPDGEIVFLDFEYFGWDDPAKMISDFLYHPAMPFKIELKRRFINKVISDFDISDQFLSRLKVLFPLFGMKWCMILLNEFPRDDFNRRLFSGNEYADQTSIRFKQLEKAKNLLKRIESGYEELQFFKSIG